MFRPTCVFYAVSIDGKHRDAEQRVPEKAAFPREGVRRGVGWRDSAWRDGVTYSLLGTDRPSAP